MAERLRNKLLGQKARGELGGPDAKVTIDRVLDAYLKDQALHVKPETLKIEKLVVEAHVRPAFGKLKAEKITSAALVNYRALRTQEGASPATCNRELAYLRTAMRTAAGTTPPMIQLASIPKFPIVSEDAFAKQGFHGGQGLREGSGGAALIPGAPRDGRVPRRDSSRRADAHRMGSGRL